MTELGRQVRGGKWGNVFRPTSDPLVVKVSRRNCPTSIPKSPAKLESFDKLLERSGPARARYLMLRLLERVGEQRVAVPALTLTDYVNTVPTELEPRLPRDEDVERHYRAWIQCSATNIVHHAQRPESLWKNISQRTSRPRTAL